MDGGIEEGVVAEFAGDAVQEDEFGGAVVAGFTVEGDGFPGVVFVVPAAAMDLHIAGEAIDEVLVVPDLAIDECADEGGGGVGTGDEDEFRVHIDRN